MLFTLNASAQTDSIPVDDFYINKKPLQDFSKSIVQKWKNKEIDLTKPFSVELEATLTKNGRFDSTLTKYVKTVGDEDIVNSFKSGIEAIGYSGYLNYLTDLDIKDFTLIVMQDNDQFSVKLISASKSNERASTFTSGLKTLLTIAKLQKENRISNLKDENKKKRETDQLSLIQNTTVSSNGNSFILEINLPKSTFQEMINRNLKEASEKRQN